MTSKLTHDILIKAVPKYLGIQEEEGQQLRLFTYKIDILNQSNQPLKLIKRYWKILDSLLPIQTINGEGVVGQKPIIKPGEKFSYESFCLLEGDFGSMEGFYTFYNIKLNEYLKIDIPKFDLISQTASN